MKNFKNLETEKSLVNASVDAKINSNMNPNPKRAHNVEPVYKVMAKARTQFKKQVLQNTGTKIMCIEKNISRCYEDAARFWLDLNKEAEDLMDSRRFTKFCEENGMVARNVAEHIIFEGKSAKKRVQNGDFSHDLDNISLFDSPLYVAPEKAEKIA